MRSSGYPSFVIEYFLEKRKLSLSSVIRKFEIFRASIFYRYYRANVGKFVDQKTFFYQ